MSPHRRQPLSTVYCALSLHPEEKASHTHRIYLIQPLSLYRRQVRVAGKFQRSRYQRSLQAFQRDQAPWAELDGVSADPTSLRAPWN